MPQNYNDRLADYVDVKERIRLFYEAHPEGSIVTDRVEIWQDDGVPRVVVKALAYRSPGDEHPGVGWSWMVLPGSTPYTKGSEIENTETSAWGRAIGSLGIGIDKSVASRDEVDAKAGEADREPERDAQTDGLIGHVEKGKSPVDMESRQTPDGTAWGFKLVDGRRGFQALAVGPLADALAVSGLKVGDQVTVWGHIEMIPWRKGDKDMPPYARLIIARVSTPDFVLPASDVAPGQETAFDLTDEALK